MKFFSILGLWAGRPPCPFGRLDPRPYPPLAPGPIWHSAENANLHGQKTWKICRPVSEGKSKNWKSVIWAGDLPRSQEECMLWATAKNAKFALRHATESGFGLPQGLGLSKEVSDLEIWRRCASVWLGLGAREGDPNIEILPKIYVT